MIAKKKTLDLKASIQNIKARAAALKPSISVWKGYILRTRQVRGRDLPNWTLQACRPRCYSLCLSVASTLQYEKLTMKSIQGLGPGPAGAVMRKRNVGVEGVSAEVDNNRSPKTPKPSTCFDHVGFLGLGLQQ